MSKTNLSEAYNTYVRERNKAAAAIKEIGGLDRDLEPMSIEDFKVNLSDIRKAYAKEGKFISKNDIARKLAEAETYTLSTKQAIGLKNSGLEEYKNLTVSQIRAKGLSDDLIVMINEERKMLAESMTGSEFAHYISAHYFGSL